MHTPPLVVILLSSYNGERYITEQLDSLARQTHRNLRVLVRDDGSSDSTPEILARYRGLGERLETIPGRNVGSNASFLELLNRAPAEAAYVCFSDQDDVWADEKVERGVRSIERIAGPALGFAGLELVDGELKRLQVLDDRVPRGARLENALVESVVTGCTITLNAAAWRALRGRDLRVGEIVMHDWWAYQAIAALGEVVYDRYPALKYRQHGTNVFGMPHGLARWRRRWTQHVQTRPGFMRRQASELLRVHGAEMPPSRREVVADFLAAVSSPSALRRARYALTAPVYRQGRMDDVALRLMIAAGRM